MVAEKLNRGEEQATISFVRSAMLTEKLPDEAGRFLMPLVCLVG